MDLTFAAVDFNLKKCARCKHLYFQVDSPVCESCMPDEEDDFHRIRDSIIANPGANAEKVAKKANVSLGCVMRMIEAERLAHNVPSEKIRCGRCGGRALSASKRLCNRCLAVLERQVIEAMIELRPKYAPKRMRGKMNDIHALVSQKRRS